MYTLEGGVRLARCCTQQTPQCVCVCQRIYESEAGFSLLAFRWVSSQRAAADVDVACSAGVCF